MSEDAFFGRLSRPLSSYRWISGRIDPPSSAPAHHEQICDAKQQRDPLRVPRAGIATVWNRML